MPARVERAAGPDLVEAPMEVVQRQAQELVRVPVEARRDRVVPVLDRGETSRVGVVREREELVAERSLPGPEPTANTPRPERLPWPQARVEGLRLAGEEPGPADVGPLGVEIREGATAPAEPGALLRGASVLCGDP
jgi:hypothetical protein